MDALPSVLSERGPIIASVVFLLSAVFLTSRLWAGERVNTKIPLVGGELGGPAKRRAAYSAQAKDLYQRGYKAFKNQVFRLTTPDGTAPSPPAGRRKLTAPRRPVCHADKVPGGAATHP